MFNNFRVKNINPAECLQYAFNIEFFKDLFTLIIFCFQQRELDFLETRETMKKSISREVHHNIVNNFFGLKISRYIFILLSADT